jgi:hypothetical protein
MLMNFFGLPEEIAEAMVNSQNSVEVSTEQTEITI